jgi:SNF2 family DNA or RNA helicase
MTKLEEVGIPFRHISGSLPTSKRVEAVKLYNEDKIKVLLITKAGGEGLDLKNTTGVILMEPAWNESANKQVIGRAVRYKSHVTLPVELRMVDIYYLFMVKPNEKDVLNDVIERALVMNELQPTEKLSVDLYMRSMSIRKQIEIDGFMDFIRRYSIEQQRCDFLK